MILVQMLPKMMFLILASALLVNHATAQICQFSINTDMQSKAPMFISTTDAKTILVPYNKDGNIQMNRGQQVYLACPGVTNEVKGYRVKMVTATCSSGKSFSINGQVQSISNIECNQHPAPYTNRIGSCAGNRGDLIEIGFEFNNIKQDRISICFNSQERRTFWAKALVSRLSPFLCTVGSKQFDKEYFGTINPDDRYTQAAQAGRLPQSYIVKNDFLEKGHLVAKCDFVDAASKRMTYYYINTAPQWKSFNGGNWRNLETTVRENAGHRNLGLVVYTGTHATLQFANADVTLDSSGKIPVPLYFWKVVIEPQSGDGVAFVGVNDPLNRHPTICPDLCGQMSWLGNFASLRTNDKSGIVYCCDVDKLKAVRNIVLPNFVEHKGGLLDD